MFDTVVRLLQENSLERCTYAEPFAGGAGLALSLLYDGQVKRIVLNDLDPAIWSFWDATLNRTDELLNKIDSTPITLEEWQAQREIYQACNLDDSVTLGFSAFFLNRTNRSGVIKGGVIGGREQNGKYLIDCRFPKPSLKDKIRRVARYKDAIELSRLDGEVFLRETDSSYSNLFYFIDPPYFQKGAGLYTNFYEKSDHDSLARSIAKLNSPWVLTYDSTPEIEKLYLDFAQYEFGINYSVATKRVGTELLIHSSNFKIPSDTSSLRNALTLRSA